MLGVDLPVVRRSNSNFRIHAELDRYILSDRTFKFRDRILTPSTKRKCDFVHWPLNSAEAQGSQCQPLELAVPTWWELEKLGTARQQQQQ